MWQKIKNYYHLAEALIASIYFNFPSKELTVIGVTGTDGKTTTATMIHHVLTSLDQKSSMVSTTEAIISNKSTDTGLHVTTPRPWQVQKFLKKAVDSNSKYFILEATSHGLDQNRLAFINFYIGVLTNITHEHLDYHKTIENYARSKAKLFKNVKYSVLNFDDESYKLVKGRVSGRVLSYSLESKSADYSLKNVHLKLKMKGHYNLQNALAAFAAVSAIGFPKAKILKSLNNFSGVKGRLEEIDLGQDFIAVVDFAHTPNSLENVLKTLKSELASKKNKLIAVFGAAGERDSAKRPKMGKVSAKFADIVVITSEDPRRENPIIIAQEIAQGLISSGKIPDKDFFTILDRKKAIRFATTLAKPGDMLAFFGKGHEKSINIEGKELPWNEVEEVEKAIEELK